MRPRSTPLEIQKREFSRRWKGLDPVEVQTFLADVAEDMESLARENVDPETRIRGLEQEIRSQDRQLKLIAEEADGVRQLVEKGMERKPRLLALEREAAEIGGARAQNVAGALRIHGECLPQRRAGHHAGGAGHRRRRADAAHQQGSVSRRVASPADHDRLAARVDSKRVRVRVGCRAGQTVRSSAAIPPGSAAPEP